MIGHLSHILRHLTPSFHHATICLHVMLKMWPFVSMVILVLARSVSAVVFRRWCIWDLEDQHKMQSANALWPSVPQQTVVTIAVLKHQNAEQSANTGLEHNLGAAYFMHNSGVAAYLGVVAFALSFGGAASFCKLSGLTNRCVHTLSS